MAKGVITGHSASVGAGISGESEVNDRKHVREDKSPGPSRSTVKEEIDSCAQRIQTLQVSRVT